MWGRLALSVGRRGGPRRRGSCVLGGAGIPSHAHARTHALHRMIGRSLARPAGCCSHAAGRARIHSIPTSKPSKRSDRICAKQSQSTACCPRRHPQEEKPRVGRQHQTPPHSLLRAEPPAPKRALPAHTLLSRSLEQLVRSPPPEGFFLDWGNKQRGLRSWGAFAAIPCVHLHRHGVGLHGVKVSADWVARAPVLGVCVCDACWPTPRRPTTKATTSSTP